MIDGNRCIRLLKSTYDPIDYAKSADICSFYGGRLADITTPELYSKVYEHVRNEWNIYKTTNRNYVHVRIATKLMVRMWFEVIKINHVCEPIFLDCKGEKDFH